MTRSSRPASAAGAAARRPYKVFPHWRTAVPFTTPVLGHARARSARGGRVELVLPNPWGGKGVYVINLGAVGERFGLTLHDRLQLAAEAAKLEDQASAALSSSG